MLLHAVICPCSACRECASVQGRTLSMGHIMQRLLESSYFHTLLRTMGFEPMISDVTSQYTHQLDLQGGALSMGQIMQRLLEGVQAELQAEERDLCAHLNAQAHLLTLEANLDGSEGKSADSSQADSKGKGKQAAVPLDEPAVSDSTVRGKRKLNGGESPFRLAFFQLPVFVE